MTRDELSSDEIRSLLDELGRRLHERGVEAQIYILGGAALALDIDTRRTTADIDVVLSGDAETLRSVASAMADEHDLPADWLDARAAAFAPGADEDAVRYSVPGLAIAVASPEHLLAMKMAAFRPGKDQADLEILFGLLGITTPEHAADLALAVYGEGSVVLPDRAELLLSARAILDRLRR